MKDLKLKEKIAICFTCCGPTYRKSAYKKLKDFYFDHEDIYYCVLTDNKKYFKDLKRKNLIVNELKDFYPRFPELEKNENFLESKSKNDYAKKFLEIGYKFPFSTYRFNLLQAMSLGVKNVVLLCTDTDFTFNVLEDSHFNMSPTIHNRISEWNDAVVNKDMHHIVDRLKDRFNLKVDDNVRVLDAAGRFFVFNNLYGLKKFFILWNDVIEHLYKEDFIKKYYGSYVVNDEYILAPIYNSVGLNTGRYSHVNTGMFIVEHNIKEERYWNTCGYGGLIENSNYQKFKKINKIK